MAIKSITNSEYRFQRIINVLLLNASFIDNLGLMHGKMGIAIFFFHLARETHNQAYENYAGELIDDIYKDINTTTPLDFENGLAGIGWGIEYLVQNGFIEADTDEVLEDFDNRLHPSSSQFQGIGMINSLTGLGAYYLKRLQNSASSDEKVTTLISKEMLVRLIDELELRVENEGVINLINKTDAFNLVWDYPILLVFLAETYKLNLFNFKVGRMLQQLTDSLFQLGNIPKQHSKRVQLAMVFEKIKKCKIEQLKDSPIDEIIQKLMVGLDRKIILKELTPNSAFMQNGTSGIAWIYNQLFQMTGKLNYQKESLHWKTSGFNFEESNYGYAGFNVANGNEGKAYGILNGLAGINLIKLLKQ